MAFILLAFLIVGAVIGVTAVLLLVRRLRADNEPIDEDRPTQVDS